MALQWADTFSKYGTNAALLLNGLYANNFNTILATDPDPTATGKVAQKQQSGVTFEDGLRFAFPGGAAATMGGGARLWLDKLPIGSTEFVGVNFCDISNTPQVGFRILSTGAIEITTGASLALGGGTVIYTTPVPIVAPNSWNHYEWKMTINNSTGAFELRVNGSPVVTLTNVDTQTSANASVAQLIFANSRNVTSNNVQMYIKDFVVWDTTGSFNNNFMGTVLCTEIYPDGDSTFTWTASTGTTGWSILDNNPPLDDSAYISAGSTLTSKYTLLNLPANVSSVRGNIIVTRARKTDSGDGNIQAGLVSGASTSLGANRAITTAYTYWIDVNETDPATGAAWIPVAFNAALLQLARTV